MLIHAWDMEYVGQSMQFSITAPRLLMDLVKNSPAWPFTLGEDCLTLNVVRPTGTNASSALPVGVFLHGGGWTMDYSANGVYNLSFMVNQSVAMEKPIVAVSLDCEFFLSKS